MFESGRSGLEEKGRKREKQKKATRFTTKLPKIDHVPLHFWE
jgi:hypothetical protein